MRRRACPAGARTGTTPCSTPTPAPWPALPNRSPRRIALAAGLRNVKGAVVLNVDANGPAGIAGIQPGDIIVALDGATVEGSDDLVRALNAERIGRSVVLSAVRKGELRHTPLVPLERAAG